MYSPLNAGNSIVFLPGTIIWDSSKITAQIAPCTFSVQNCGTHDKGDENLFQTENNEGNNSVDNITETDEISSYKVILHPNPNSGTFQLETNFPLLNIGNFKVLNILGATVYETRNLSFNTIRLQNSASGQHFVVIILNDGTVLTQKMMIQR